MQDMDVKAASLIVFNNIVTNKTKLFYLIVSCCYARYDYGTCIATYHRHTFFVINSWYGKCFIPVFLSEKIGR